MRFAILDLSYPVSRQSRGMASLWLEWRLAQSSLRPVGLNRADIVLITSVSPTQAGKLKAIRKAVPHAKLVVGGPGATAPAAYLDAADAVCVGEGHRAISAVLKSWDRMLTLPNVATRESKKVTPDERFPWRMPPMQLEDGSYAIALARGCPRRCAFCTTGWASSYRETPSPARCRKDAQHLARGGHRVTYLTNDLALHSWIDGFPASGSGSVSLAGLKHVGVPPARQLRIGVEGVSERLRNAVGKPMSDEDLVAVTSRLCGMGKSVRWFMIAGLPGETDSDWDRLRDAVQRFKATTPKGVLCLSFTAYHAEPPTPLYGMARDDSYWARWLAFKDWFFGGAGFSRRVKLCAPQQPKSRSLVDMAVCCVGEQELASGATRNPNAELVAYPHRERLATARRRYLHALEGDRG